MLIESDNFEVTEPQNALNNASLQAALASDAGFISLYNETVRASQDAQLKRYLAGLVIWRRQIELKQQGKKLEDWVESLEEAGLVSRRTIFNYKAEAKSATLALFTTGRFFNDLRLDAPEDGEPEAAFFKRLLPAIDLSMFDEPEQVQRLAAAHHDLQTELSLRGADKPRLWKLDRKHLSVWLDKFQPTHAGKRFEQLPARIQKDYRETGCKWDPRTIEEVRQEHRDALIKAAVESLDMFMREVLDVPYAKDAEPEDWRSIHHMVAQVYQHTKQLAEAGKGAA